jgi:hypothetical protein
VYTEGYLLLLLSNIRMKTATTYAQAIIGKNPFLMSFFAASLIMSLLLVSFFIVEPQISHGNENVDFRIRQTITDETSFLIDPTNVTMNASISGITGGNATGTTRFVVRSNNASGYYVEIDFFDNPGRYAMLGDESSSEALRDYGGDVAGQPSYNLTASTAAQFAYSAYSSTTADTDPSFKNNGSACNTGATQTIGKCWKSPSTTGFRVVDRSIPASSGATSTLYFRVNVPAGANPTPSAETYTATATLSVFAQ